VLANAQTGRSNCSTENDGNPHFFWVYLDINGTEHCNFNSANLGDTTIRFTANDPTLSGEFTAYLDGNAQVPDYEADFTGGLPATNGERHSTVSDSGVADFHDLQFNHAGSWNDWSGTKCYFADDPSYYGHHPSDTHVTDNTTSSGCP
jgi:hypothetical protein